MNVEGTVWLFECRSENVVSACLCGCVYVCMYVCMCMCICVCVSCVSCLSVCATTSYYAGMFAIHIVPTLIIIESFEIISCGPRAGVVIVKIIMFIILL